MDEQRKPIYRPDRAIDQQMIKRALENVERSLEILERPFPSTFMGYNIRGETEAVIFELSCGMDLAMQLRHLKEAEQHIAQGERHIAEQEDRNKGHVPAGPSHRRSPEASG
jgi:hypothetical protein